MKIYRIISRYKINEYENDDMVLYEYTDYKKAKKHFDQIITEDLEDQLVLSELDDSDDYSSSIELEVKDFPKGEEDEFIVL